MNSTKTETGATVTIEWTTTIVERHRAEIDRGNWEHMEANGNTADALADYEGEESCLEAEVTDREAEAVDEGERMEAEKARIKTAERIAEGLYVDLDAAILTSAKPGPEVMAGFRRMLTAAVRAGMDAR